MVGLSIMCFLSCYIVFEHFFSAYVPSVVVGVVGMGHVPGIKDNWEELQYDIKDIMT
jgi:hypothetical protein